jgi:signal transduction histidine kinase
MDADQRTRLPSRLQEVATGLEHEWRRSADSLAALAQTCAARGREDHARRLRSMATRARLQGTAAQWTAIRWCSVDGDGRPGDASHGASGSGQDGDRPQPAVGDATGAPGEPRLPPDGVRDITPAALHERVLLAELRTDIAVTLFDEVLRALFAAALSLHGVAADLAPSDASDRLQAAADGLDPTIKTITRTAYLLRFPPPAGP